VQIEAILYASLAASLFSAFLAMLGKQWLNQYASVDTRGSVIQRSQNRQRKLDGIDRWYFDHVIESLPVMLQLALLLLGCALSLYLWGVNTAVASVIVGITSLGVLLYILIVVAGTVSVNCPYQTPGAHILRHIFHLLYQIPSRASDLLHWVSSVVDRYTPVDMLRSVMDSCKALECSMVDICFGVMMLFILPIVLSAYLGLSVYSLGAEVAAG